MNMKRDGIKYLDWKFNYDNDSAWIPEVMKYVNHLETTILNIEGTLELSCVEPKECNHEEVARSIYDYLQQQMKYLKTVKVCGDDIVFDMNKRLSEVNL